MTAADASTTPGPAWKVVTQTQGMGRNKAGNYVQGWTVTYQLASGSSGSVFLAQGDYTPANVKAAINAQAADVDGVDNLTSDS